MANTRVSWLFSYTITCHEVKTHFVIHSKLSDVEYFSIITQGRPWITSIGRCHHADPLAPNMLQTISSEVVLKNTIVPVFVKKSGRIWIHRRHTSTSDSKHNDKKSNTTKPHKYGPVHCTYMHTWPTAQITKTIERSKANVYDRYLINVDPMAMLSGRGSASLALFMLTLISMSKS